MRVNDSIALMVRGVPPFPFVRESLEKLNTKADVLVVSATPNEALHREWDEHDLTKYTVAICGQEIGTKKESLAAAAKYPAGHTLMIGDAPGDHKAAVANNVLFYPINPGAGGGELAAVLQRSDRPVFQRHVRRRVRSGIVGRVRPPLARAAARGR